MGRRPSPRYSHATFQDIPSSTERLKDLTRAEEFPAPKRATEGQTSEDRKLRESTYRNNATQDSQEFAKKFLMKRKIVSVRVNNIVFAEFQSFENSITVPTCDDCMRGNNKGAGRVFTDLNSASKTRVEVDVTVDPYFISLSPVLINNFQKHWFVSTAHRLMRVAGYPVRE